MIDPHPRSPVTDQRSYWKKIQDFIHPGPDSQEELLSTLTEAETNRLINADSRVMLEGVLRLAQLTAGDVLVPATRMDMIDVDAPVDQILNEVIDARHSRFPVFEGHRDNVIGILLAKDLLKLQRSPNLHLRTMLRSAVFIPESKGLNDLLRDFRNTRNHMALVIDEFGSMAGLITIEDVLEQIVGDIEDEFDEAGDAGDVYALADKTYRVSGDSSLERVQEAFGLPEHAFLPYLDEDHRFDTIGGLIAHVMGHVPRRGESLQLGELKFEVMHTRAGVVKWFKVHPLMRENGGVT